MNARHTESSSLATELIRLLESIGDPTLTVALSFAAIVAKWERGEIGDALQLAQRVIDLADGDPNMGNLLVGSPLSSAIGCRGASRSCFGIPGWRDDLHDAITMSRGIDATTLAGTAWFSYTPAIPYGLMVPDATALRDTAEALAIAEQSGDDLAVDLARTARGVTLVHHDGPEREAGVDLLEKVRQSALAERFALGPLAIADIHIAREKARRGDIDGATSLAGTVVEHLYSSGGSIWTALATGVLVEALLQRSAEGDVDDAQRAIDRLAAFQTEPGVVLHDIWLLRLRALTAQAQGRDASYREFRDSYRKMATDLGFEGHMAWAQAMP
jgi:adenylate cyclase